MINGLYNSLLSSIGVNVHSERVDKDELIRACISASAKNAYISVWDRLGGEVSIEHFKKRVVESLNGFKQLFPSQLGWLDKDVMNVIANKVYDYYIYCGFLYHSPNNIIASMRKECGNDIITLIRSPRPQDNVLMSGIGYYQKGSSQNQLTSSAVFHISDHTLDEMYVHIQNLEYSKVEIPENMDFLRIDEPFSKGYWQKDINRVAKFGVCRLNTEVKEYYLYHLENDTFSIHRIPDLLAVDGEYREYSCAILKHEGTLPSIKFEDNGKLVKIRFGYLLPARIQKLIEMYSWAVVYPADNAHNRIINKEVFLLFVQLLNRLGFEVEEMRK